jgi:isopentenyl diphosphate isomerase/L-lactate dehydrogenase-like FMN-dependent dehydrogenase
MGRVNNFQTWRSEAKGRLPKVVFDFIDGGAEDEITLRRNRTAFEDLALIPRVLGGVDDVSSEIELFGQRLRLPVLLAPAGNARAAGPQGEIAQAKGASAAGTISVLASFTSVPSELVAKSVPEPQWGQLYLLRNRDTTLEIVERAKRLHFSVLVLTADTPVAGNRERDKRNGMKVPLRITPSMAGSVFLRPEWFWHYITGRPIADHVDLRSPKGPASPARDSKSHAEYVASVLSPKQTWEDLKWLRSIWEGPLLLKGVMCREDAELAIAAGCEGVIVSNHGGRQLDGAPATIEMLPEVVSAVDGRGVVLIDGGIRRGTDVVKALSLGAKACLIGRPWLYGLAAGGDAQVKNVIDEFQSEIVRTLKLMGVSNLAQLGPHNLRRRPGSGWERFADSARPSPLRGPAAKP